MSAVNIIAITAPAPGKEKRFRELMQKAAKDIYAKEEGSCLRFLVTEEIDAESGETRYVLVETYRDMDAAGRHENSEHYKAFFKATSDEGLMQEPLRLSRRRLQWDSISTDTLSQTAQLATDHYEAVAHSLGFRPPLCSVALRVQPVHHLFSNGAHGGRFGDLGTVDRTTIFGLSHQVRTDVSDKASI